MLDFALNIAVIWIGKYTYDDQPRNPNIMDDIFICFLLCYT